MYLEYAPCTPLNKTAALVAVQRLSGLPHTKQVFALIGRHCKYTLVWVRKDGTRRNISTQEQVYHALSA